MFRTDGEDYVIGGGLDDDLDKLKPQRRLAPGGHRGEVRVAVEAEPEQYAATGWSGVRQHPSGELGGAPNFLEKSARPSRARVGRCTTTGSGERRTRIAPARRRVPAAGRSNSPPEHDPSG